MTDQDLRLRVYVDGECPACRRLGAWLQRQPKYVRLDCVPAQAAGRGCALTMEQLLAQVTVVASDGAVYRGVNAWLICLWALRGYRGWSLRLAKPSLRPWAERLFGVVTGVAAWSKRVGAAGRTPVL